ncbi:DUF2750 domain-containing protein [Halopseudomonas salegens]|uniref:DUF2750 domain-containing protein n=1 Tax=Halopseudomonas salegens TaxID=1434072 RepID=A0A1H2G998_9GAMM|nr:DUF2750 domain-containing protein [Halopseudomonas salegens]SDU16213.1 Protein of unknown function [Halopseudomonas salegens]
MPYKMNPQQFDAVLALSSADRSSHFVGKVADWGQLWGVKNDLGWLVPITPEDLEYFPVWPHPEYAQKIVDEHFPGHHAVEIALEEFLSHWLPTFEADNVKVAVFPNKEWVFWVMEPADLAQCLRDEAAQYE